MTMVLKWKRLHPDAKAPERKSELAAGYDLCAVTETSVLAVAYVPIMFKVRTGVAVEISPGYEGQLRARSSLAVDFIILANSVGTIDADYRGEIMVPLIKLGGCERIIQPGERIAQLIISPIATPEVVEVEELSNTARGAGGFGSTGR